MGVNLCKKMYGLYHVPLSQAYTETKCDCESAKLFIPKAAQSDPSPDDGSHKLIFSS